MAGRMAGPAGLTATILHNPRCSKSRAALALLREAGADVRVVEYLTAPPSRDKLARLLARAGLAPAACLRPDAPAKARASDDAALDAMAEDPALIERPLVETANGVILARPPERVLDLL